MKPFMFMLLAALASSAVGQTMYKCPSPAGTAHYQQTPCEGGETHAVKPIPSGQGAGLSDEAKAYLDERTAHREEKARANEPSESDSLSQHIKKIKTEQLAKDCYALEKRIRYIQSLEARDVHLKQHSIGDEESREAIEQYKRKCGHWRG